MSAGERTESGNARARDRQVHDKTKPKTGINSDQNLVSCYFSVRVFSVL